MLSRVSGLAALAATASLCVDHLSEMVAVAGKDSAGYMRDSGRGETARRGRVEAGVPPARSGSWRDAGGRVVRLAVEQLLIDESAPQLRDRCRANSLQRLLRILLAQILGSVDHWRA